MIRVSAYYPNADNARFDHSYYTNEHRALVRRRLDAFGLTSVDLERGISDATGGQPPYIGAGHLTFKTVEGFQEAWAAHGTEILSDIARFTNTRPVVQISEVI